MKTRIYRVDCLKKANELLKKKAGVMEFLWCGEEKCGHKLEEHINAKLLGIPVDIEEKIQGKCVVCSKKASNLVWVAIAY